MNRGLMTLVASLCCSIVACAQGNSTYKTGDVSDIHPQGWLHTMLQRQHDGLTGHPEALSYPYNSCLWAGEISRPDESYGDKWMAGGFRIETPIGTFSAKIELKRDISNPDDIKHTDVELKGIDFRSSKEFEKELKISIGSDGFRYIRKPTSSRILNNIQHLEEALHKSIKANNGYTTVASFARYSHLTEYSARKQLDHWCYGDTPKLKMSRVSHAHIYTEI